MADSTSPLDPVVAGTSAVQQVNESEDATSPAALYGRRASACGGLEFGYYGGRWGSTAIPNGTVTASANTTSYVVAARSDGAVSIATATTNWNNSTDYLRLYKLVTDSSNVTSYEDHRQAYGDAGTAAAPVQSIIIACGDETTAITTGTAKVTFRMPYAFTVSAVRASLKTAQSSGSIFTVDINEGGVSILSTKLTIDNSETTSTTAATPAVISDSSLADDAEITIDVDQVGTGAVGLKVALIGTKV